MPGFRLTEERHQLVCLSCGSTDDVFNAQVQRKIIYKVTVLGRRQIDMPNGDSARQNITLDYFDRDDDDESEETTGLECANCGEPFAEDDHAMIAELERLGYQAPALANPETPVQDQRDEDATIRAHAETLGEMQDHRTYGNGELPKKGTCPACKTEYILEPREQEPECIKCGVQLNIVNERS